MKGSGIFSGKSRVLALALALHLHLELLFCLEVDMRREPRPGLGVLVESGLEGPHLPQVRMGHFIWPASWAPD